ncbi:dienelactone hydrolase family protein [Sphingomonas parva]|uniref:Dienelactone hydrolase family protein n=1 Tax=Sphingomonas parva TaxID=2555898 RepID=A0A4Y8ZKW0_9SPHN|nr:dienelactone hydrolase family protein [Sphingomonas parva]TFI56618.1 dienelactone hydrolase family protein [Sphingomonas parva]
MCERDTIAAGFDWAVNRRELALGALASLAACSGRSAGGSAAALSEERVRLATPDGTMDAFFVAPARGRHPAILTWPDIAGLRDAYQVMARRLAGDGYSVLVADTYYREAPAPRFRDLADFAAQDGFRRSEAWRAKLDAAAIGRDAAAAIAWLDGRPEVDTKRGVGTHGYCLGGAYTVWAAAAVPERVHAAASFHGWRLVVPDDPQSPHRLLGRTKAQYLFAIGRNDDAKDPGEKEVLRAAAAAAGRPAEIEVYPADHGWMTIDSDVYDRAAAERGWARMRALFRTM